MAAAAILSACTGQQDAPAVGSTTTAPPATMTPAATTAVVAPAQATTSAQAAKPAPAKVSVCASATEAALEAALKADEKLSGALIVDGNGLQRIKCVLPWAFARFTNEIDGGSVLFTHRNGTWVPVNGGTGELCEEVPPATAKQICY
ncbi:hypothetical protein AB0J40_03680 [Amycolatopsis sp. NPDC049691]|uniref:hypothetical protein n=1 Tax=Amycolatopsis sp. NPDC049691 TaxID=3155155 RepID=UPI00341A1FDF